MLPVRWCVSGLRCDCVSLMGRELSPSGVVVVLGWCWGVSPSDGVCRARVVLGCLPVRCLCRARVVLGCLPVRWCLSCLVGVGVSPCQMVFVVLGWCWGVSLSGVFVVLGWCWGVSLSDGVCHAWLVLGYLPCHAAPPSSRPPPRALRPSVHRSSSCARGLSWSVACGSRSLVGVNPPPCFERADVHRWTATMALGPVL